MKKLISLTAAILAAATSFAIEWSDAIPNLAEGATVVAVSSNSSSMQNIVDGNDGTNWQAAGQANHYANDWALIDLGSEKTFTDVEIKWEASHASAYSIYISTELPIYAETTFEESKTYNVIDSWIAGKTPTFTSSLEGEAGVTDNLTCSGVTGRYLLIYCTAYNNWAKTYGANIFEVKIANIEGRDEVGALRVNASSVLEGESATVTVDVLNKIGTLLPIDKVENLTLTCSDPEAVEITAGENGSYTVKGLKRGTFTLTASASAEGQTVSGTASFKVEYNWNGKNIITSDMAVYARFKADTEYLNPATNAIDGNNATYYEFNGDWGGGDCWLIIDLGQEYVISTIGALYGEKSGGKYRVGYAPDGAGIPAANADCNFVMQSNTLEGWNWTDQLDRTTEALNNYEFASPVVARYIAVRDADNPNGKPQVCEVYAAGVVHEVSKVNSIVLSAAHNNIASDEKVALSAKVYDQYGAEMPDKTAAFQVDGVDIEGTEFTAAEVGTYSITAVCDEVVSEPLEIRIVAQVDTKVTPAHSATFGGEEHTGNPFTQETQWTELNKTLVVTFEKAHDLSLIKLRWEAACPSDYTVEVTYGDGSKATVLNLTGRGFVGGFNPIDRIIHSAPAAEHSPMRRAAATSTSNLSNVKSIAITPTAKDHGWNLRLFGIDTYGTEATDGGSTGIEAVADQDAPVEVYNLAGVKVADSTASLPAGIYIVRQGTATTKTIIR